MAVIIKRIRIVGAFDEEQVDALFDSGATYSCIRPDLACRLGETEPLREPMDFGTAKEGETVRATESITLSSYIGEYYFYDEFIIIPGLSEQVIIGAATLQKWRMILDFERDEVSFAS